MDPAIQERLNWLKNEFNQLSRGLAPGSKPEMEVRAGTVEERRFNSSVSRFLFGSVVETLSTVAKREAIDFQYTVDYMYHYTPRPGDNRQIDPRNVRLRRTVTEDGREFWISKYQIPEWKVDIPQYNLRVSLAVETEIQPRPDLAPTGERRKHRIIFNFASMRIECTHVQFRHFIEEGARDSFEIEMEYNNMSQFDNDRMWFIRLLQGMSRFPMDVRGYHELRNQLNHIFDGEESRRNLYPKPRDLNRNDIPHLHKYVVTDKSDGVRKWLYISPFGLLMMNPERDHSVVKRITPVQYKRGVGTLIEGEYIPERNEFLIFDILALDGRDVRKSHFRDRKTLVNKVAEWLPGTINKGDLNVTHKHFFQYKDIQKAFDRLEGLPYDTDGLIFTPKNEGYEPRHHPILKWKPHNKLTIDLLLRKGKDGAFDLHAGEKNRRTVHFRDATYKPQPDEVIGGIRPREGFIVEFGFEGSVEGGVWRPHRIRHDKIVPNFITVAEDVWKHIQNPVTKEELIAKKGESAPVDEEKETEKPIEREDGIVNESRVKGMNQYHNLVVKDRIIRSIPRDSAVLDIGSGRGGDLNRYMRRGIEVWAIEPNQEHIDDMRTRVEKKNYTHKWHIIKAGGGDSELILDDESGIKCRGLKTITSFFSLSYFFQDEQKLDEFMETIRRVRDKCRPPIRFVGTTIDGQAMYDMLKDAKKGIRSAKFRIDKHYENDDKIGFGKHIKFHIEDSRTAREIDEWLVDFDLLTKKMESIGFRLESTRMFDPPNTLCVEEKQLSSRYREFAFISEGAKSQKIYGVMDMLPMDRMRYYTRNLLGEQFKWVRIGTLIAGEHGTNKGQGSCLIHGILRSAKPFYLELPSEQRVRLAGELRNWLSTSIRLQDYAELAGGDTAVHQTQSVFIEEAMAPFTRGKKGDTSHIVYTTEDELRNLFKSPHSLMDLADTLHRGVDFLPDETVDELLARSLVRAYQNFQQDLRDCDSYLGDDYFEYVANMFDLDVYVVDARFGKPVVLGTRDALYKGRPSIVLLLVNGNHWESLGIEVDSTVQTLFNPDHPLIRFLTEKITE